MAASSSSSIAAVALGALEPHGSVLDGSYTARITRLGGVPRAELQFRIEFKDLTLPKVQKIGGEWILRFQLCDENSNHRVEPFDTQPFLLTKALRHVVATAKKSSASAGTSSSEANEVKTEKLIYRPGITAAMGAPNLMFGYVEAFGKYVNIEMEFAPGLVCEKDFVSATLMHLAEAPSLPRPFGAAVLRGGKTAASETTATPASATPVAPSSDPATAVDELRGFLSMLAEPQRSHASMVFASLPADCRDIALADLRGHAIEAWRATARLWCEQMQRRQIKSPHDLQALGAEVSSAMTESLATTSATLLTAPPMPPLFDSEQLPEQLGLPEALDASPVEEPTPESPIPVSATDLEPDADPFTYFEEGPARKAAKYRSLAYRSLATPSVATVAYRSLAQPPAPATRAKSTLGPIELISRALASYSATRENLPPNPRA